MRTAGRQAGRQMINSTSPRTWRHAIRAPLERAAELDGAAVEKFSDFPMPAESSQEPRTAASRTASPRQTNPYATSMTPSFKYSKSLSLWRTLGPPWRLPIAPRRRRHWPTVQRQPPGQPSAVQPPSLVAPALAGPVLPAGFPPSPRPRQLRRRKLPAPAPASRPNTHAGVVRRIGDPLPGWIQIRS